MRIAFVNPRFPPSLWDFSECRDLDGSSYAHPPLALPTLAALTPRPHQVVLIDENVESLPVSTLAGDAELVGLTGYYVQRERVFELADELRARGVRVAIGGPIVETSTLDECLRHADHVFWGEAEYTWPRFLGDLERGAPERLYHQKEWVDLRDSPVPRYELLRLDRYTTATVETSRGCPYSCEFCEIPARLGKKARSKSVEQVLAEVRLLYALGAESIFLIDDHFVGNRGHALKVLEALGRFVGETGHRLYFSCQFTINLAKDDALLEAMHRANVRRVFVGIETPRKESLLEVKKKQNTLGELPELVARVQRYNILVWAGLIVGFDHDDEAVFEEQARLLDEAGVPVAMIGLLQAIPGTPLYERMAARGRLRNVEMAGVRGQAAALLVSNIVPIGMSDEALVRGYQRLIRRLYEPDAYATRLLTGLERGAAPQPAQAGGVSWRNLQIVARMLRWYAGDGARRRMLRKVLGTVLRERPSELGTAIMHLVVYKHLQRFYHAIAALPLPRLGSATVGVARETMAIPSPAIR